MCRRVNALETTVTVFRSSNLGKFTKLFESEDTLWINKINVELEE